jgi:hypothetical protein
MMLIAWSKGSRTKDFDLLKCPKTTIIITNKKDGRGGHCVRG